MRAEKDKIKDTGDLKEVSRFILQMKALTGRLQGKVSSPAVWQVRRPDLPCG